MFLSSFKSITLLVACVVLFSLGGYANSDNLRILDPSLPLEASISSCVKEAQENLWLAQLEFEQAERKHEDYSFEGCFLRATNAPSPRPIPGPIDHLAHDQKSFAVAKYTLDLIAKKTANTRKKLKTNTARKTLDAALVGASVETGDIEKALNRWSKKLPKKYLVNAVDIALHDRFQEASSKAFPILLAYIKPGILVGSTDEQADMKILCDYIYAVDSILDDSCEEGRFYDALSRHFVKCYDAVPKIDIVARAKILKYINSFGQHALAAVDDPDDYEEQYAVVNLTKNYELAIQLGFVDRTKSTPQKFIFKNTSTFERFDSFAKLAPSVFEFCGNQTLVVIESTLQTKGWDRWVQRGNSYIHSLNAQGNQVIWVDPNGSTSLRLKADSKEFTVGFLSEYISPNALYKDYSNYLYSEQTELVKYALYENMSFFVPARHIASGRTLFWACAGETLRTALMNKAHGKYL
jgi:hypothetical protein